jgi:hypothetical protein
MQALSGHDNLIRLQHVIKAENGRDIYLTFDHMGNLCKQFILLIGALHTISVAAACNS